MLGLAVTALLSGCCSEDARIADLETRNKAVVLHVHEEIAKGNVEVFDEVLLLQWDSQNQSTNHGGLHAFLVKDGMTYLHPPIN